MSDTDDRPLPFRELPSFRLERLAALSTRLSELRYQRLFDLRGAECRVIGVVGTHGPIALRPVCEQAGLDKSHGSRLVARLVERGLVQRSDDPGDQRAIRLQLSERGRALYRRLRSEADVRNREWLGGLPAEEQDRFLAALELLTRHSERLLAQERGGGRRGSSAADGEPVAAAAALPATPGPVLDRALAEQLYRALGAALGR